MEQLHLVSLRFLEGSSESQHPEHTPSNGSLNFPPAQSFQVSPIIISPFEEISLLFVFRTQISPIHTTQKTTLTLKNILKARWPSCLSNIF